MLEIKNLHAKVDDKMILNGIDLSVGAGEVHAIMGPNGSGKSTLAYLLAGRPGYEATEGEALLDGKNLLDMEPEDRAVADWFEQILAAGADARAAANWITGEVFRRLKELDGAIEDVPVTPAQLAELIGLVTATTISGSAAKEVFAVMWDDGGSPTKIVEDRGLQQVSDTGELEGQIDAVIAEHADAADKIRAGDDKPIQFLMGMVMRATKGKANPQMVQQLLRGKLQG